MASRDLAIASLSAAAGAVAAVAAHRFLSSYTATNAEPQNPPLPRGEPLAVNGSTARSPPAQDPYKITKREGLVLVVRPSFTTPRGRASRSFVAALVKHE